MISWVWLSVVENGQVVVSQWLIMSTGGLPGNNGLYIYIVNNG